VRRAVTEIATRAGEILGHLGDRPLLRRGTRTARVRHTGGIGRGADRVVGDSH